LNSNNIFIKFKKWSKKKLRLSKIKYRQHLDQVLQMQLKN
jgi:hypothetical protein